MGALILFLLVSLPFAAMIFIHRGLPGSVKDIGWKMTGIWTNPKNLRVLLHASGSLLRGHIVTFGNPNVNPDRALVIKQVEVKPLWRWSDGTFIEPDSREEHRVRLRLKGTRTLTVKFLSKNRTEEWKLVDPM